MTTPEVSAAVSAALARARAVLAEARHVLVVTGAGISRSAGILTYADLENHDPTHLHWLRADEYRFHRDPCTVWRVTEERRQQMLSVQPTPAHLALARWAARFTGAVIATQNVDGLHERAAMTCGNVDDERRIHCLHGTLLRGRCTRCGRTCDLPATIDSSARERLPHCLHCRKLIRPAVVWFGERLNMQVMRPALRAAVSADACLVIGTRLDVFPAAGLPQRAYGNGAHLIEVNPVPTRSEDARTIPIPLPADLAIPALLDGLLSNSPPTTPPPKRPPPGLTRMD